MKKRLFLIMLALCMLCVGIFGSAAENDLRGDADSDQKITASDAAIVLRYSVGKISKTTLLTRTKICSDINFNGALDADDALRILRHVVNLSQLGALPALDTTLYNNLKKNTTLNNDTAEWLARMISALPTSNQYRAVLYKAAALNGTPYGTGTGQLDCSMFVRKAFYDAGIPNTVYPGGSSDNVRKFFKNAGKLKDVVYLNNGTTAASVDTGSWKPGYVLIYMDQSTGKANHIALFMGNIDGSPYIMDSGRSRNGVNLSDLWTSDTYKLTYYADPLG